MDKENKTKIAKFIKMQRIAQDLKQDELAKNAGLSSKTLQHIENAKDVRDTSINKALSALGFKVVQKVVIEIIPIDENC